MNAPDAGRACGHGLRETLPRAAAHVSAHVVATDGAAARFPGAIVGVAFVASVGCAIALRSFSVWRRHARPNQAPKI